MASLFEKHKKSNFLVFAGPSGGFKTSLGIKWAIKSDLEGKKVSFMAFDQLPDTIVEKFAKLNDLKQPLNNLSLIVPEESNNTFEAIRATIMEDGKPDVLIVDGLQLLLGYFNKSLDDISDFMKSLSAEGIQVIVTALINRQATAMLASDGKIDFRKYKEAGWMKHLRGNSDSYYFLMPTDVEGKSLKLYNPKAKGEASHLELPLKDGWNPQI